MAIRRTYSGGEERSVGDAVGVRGGGDQSPFPQSIRVRPRCQAE